MLAWQCGPGGESANAAIADPAVNAAATGYTGSGLMGLGVAGSCGISFGIYCGGIGTLAPPRTPTLYRTQVAICPMRSSQHPH